MQPNPFRRPRINDLRRRPDREIRTYGYRLELRCKAGYQAPWSDPAQPPDSQTDDPTPGGIRKKIYASVAAKCRESHAPALPQNEERPQVLAAVAYSSRVREGT